MGLFSRLRAGRERPAASASASTAGSDAAALLAAAGDAHRRRDFDEAIRLYKALLAIEPGRADVMFALANCELSRGRKAEAEAGYRAVVALRPDAGLAHANLGTLLAERGLLDDALDCYGRAIAAGDSALVRFNLANVQKDLGRIEESVANLRRAVELDPAMADAHYNLANSLGAPEQSDEAIRHYRLALAQRPGFVEAHHNLGNLLEKSGRVREAIECYRAALALRPDFVGAVTNLGLALNNVGELTEAAAFLERAVALRPAHAPGYGNLGNVLMNLGRFDEAIAAYRRGIEIDPHAWSIHSGLLMAMNYGPSSSAEERLDQAQRFGDLLTKSVASHYTQWTCIPEPARLRVGFVSGDLRQHPVGYFVSGLMKHLDRSRVEAFAYPTHTLEDELTASLRPQFAAWKPITGLDDEAAAARIHEDGVHVLVDLSGHTAHNRLPMFAQRPAPVQATWLGYYATTGMTQVDWWIADPHVVPEEEASQFVEKVKRLPDSYLCFSVPAEAPAEVAPPPCLAAGRVTFGSFNNLAKLNDEVVALWARVLRAVPDSRLMLKALHFADDDARARTLRRFVDAGVDGSRLVLEGPAPRRELLRAYERVDIALDPFPYPGGTTSVESLWMGVPVVTRRGERFLSHVGESIAHAAGLAEWIADDDDDYVAKAARFAADSARLAALRGSMRGRLVNSPLFDAARFARNFEAILWDVWRARR